MAQYVICVSFYFFSWGIHYIHFWWFFKFSLKQKWKSRLKWMSDDTLHNPTKLATKAYYYWWGESLAMLVFGSMATKGQLISKCLFGVFNFFKKRTKKVNLRYRVIGNEREFIYGHVGPFLVIFLPTVSISFTKLRLRLLFWCA